ncbi:hypothetical protein HOG47_03045 [archaeon]|jgi:hypothetical protein|nr:hypothetical protein [archaeon]
MDYLESIINDIKIAEDTKLENREELLIHTEFGYNKIIKSVEKKGKDKWEITKAIEELKEDYYSFLDNLCKEEQELWDEDFEELTHYFSYTDSEGRYNDSHLYSTPFRYSYNDLEDEIKSILNIPETFYFSHDFAVKYESDIEKEMEKINGYDIFEEHRKETPNIFSMVAYNLDGGEQPFPFGFINEKSIIKIYALAISENFRMM